MLNDPDSINFANMIDDVILKVFDNFAIKGFSQFQKSLIFMAIFATQYTELLQKTKAITNLHHLLTSLTNIHH